MISTGKQLWFLIHTMRNVTECPANVTMIAERWWVTFPQDIPQ
jgi:hypothetical protein